MDVYNVSVCGLGVLNVSLVKLLQLGDKLFLKTWKRVLGQVIVIIPNLNVLDNVQELFSAVEMIHGHRICHFVRHAINVNVSIDTKEKHCAENVLIVCYNMKER